MTEREICEGVFCVDCPMLELLSDEFTEGDRIDAFNSMVVLRSTIKDRENGFKRWEFDRLASEARQIGHYTSDTVSRVAVRSLERQITDNCELLKEGV
jgi:hypothetical protein